MRQPGDANEDREFNAADIVQVLAGGKYETGEPATWSEGDWSGAPNAELTLSAPIGDGLFDSLDIVAALSAGLYETGPYAAQLDSRKIDPRPVPEPSGLVLLAMGIAWLGIIRRFSPTS